MAPDGRRDTLAFKERLNQVLGSNATHYWSALKEFLTGRLNRDEFDHWATLYLPKDKGKPTSERERESIGLPQY